jgi:hypothetical protein
MQRPKGAQSAISHNVYYVKSLIARVRYYGGLLKLVLASILPAKGPKDKASIDACVST